MQVHAADLRHRMTSLSGEDLNAILEASDGEYTDDAREAARLELQSRIASPEQYVQSGSLAPKYVTSFRVEDTILSVFRRITAPVRAYREWRENLLPRQTPTAIRNLFWIAVASALSAALVLVPAAYNIIVNQNLTRALERLRDGTFELTLGTAGFLLAYGIWTKRSYSRYLAVGMVVILAAYSVWSHWRELQFSSEDIAIVGGAIATVKYLLNSHEAAAYLHPEKGEA